jgi:hypothetical protein
MPSIKEVHNIILQAVSSRGIYKKDSRTSSRRIFTNLVLRSSSPIIFFEA